MSNKHTKQTSVDQFTLQYAGSEIKAADRIEENIMLLAFLRSSDRSASYYKLANGMVDEYQDETGVNTGACVNQSYDGTNKLYTPSSGGIDSYSKLVLQNNVAAGQVKAIYFDGTGDYLTVADHADWDFGTGNFCIEGWFYFSSVSGTQVLVDRGVRADFQLSMESGSLKFYSGSTLRITHPTAVIANRWYHIEVTRAGTDVNQTIVAIDGNWILSSPPLGQVPENFSSANGIAIGANTSGTSPFNGFMKEIRISNVARYTASFTPTATLFTADSNTKLLIHAEEAVGAVSFADSETTPKTITTNGDCKIKLTAPLMEAVFLDTEITAKTITTVGAAKQIPYQFNKSAGFFNGTTDYVLVPDSADWDFGTADFTIEFWAMLLASDSGTSIVTRDATASYPPFWINLTDGVYLTSNGSSWDIASGKSTGGVPILRTWYHIAVCRSGNNFYAFRNGVQTDTWTSSLGLFANANPLSIGRAQTTHYFNGWFKELRISNSARYTTTFTPSTTQFTADSNTKLLLHFDTSATAPLSPAIYFNGSTDYLTLGNLTDWNLGAAASGDFAIEGWFYWNSVSDTAILGPYNGGGVNGWYLAIVSQRIYVWSGNGTGRYASETTDALVVNRWYHIALTRSGSTIACFIDGRKTVTSIADGDFNNDTVVLNVGWCSSVGYFSGYAKEIRISKGIARYTTAFTPSQTAFVADSYTKLLIHGSENNGAVTFIDSETTPKTITTVGSTVIKYTEDYRNTIFLDSETTPKYPYPMGLAKIDFVAPFGTGVGYFGGSGNYLTLDDSADWDLADPCTIDAWVKWTTVGNSGIVEHFGSAGNSWRFEYDTGAFRFVTATGGSPTYLTQYTWVPIANTWYHIQYVRSGSNNLLFVNGNLVVSNVSATAIVNVTGTLRIGYTQNDAYYLTGFLDNVRISNTARNTATFNPPSADFVTYNNMSLRSIAFAATATPKDDRLVLYEEDIDTITLNTDLKAYASRDNGTTWTQITLVNEGYYNSTRRILAGIADISAQPVLSSYNMIYKVETLNNKGLKLRGAAMNWG